MDESTARSRHPDSMRSAFLWALLPTLLLVLNVPYATYAQVATNITPTTIAPLDLGTNVDTVGTTTQIMGGTRPNNGPDPGTNLFHSFDAFTLGTGDIAHFMNDMMLPTTNIIGRVIGGEVSTIDGTLRTNNPLDAADPMNFGAANLWLVNPSGLLLGPNARLEVGGSVSMSTANYLRFEGQAALFDMLSTPVLLGQLSVAPVVAFGFLGPELPAPIVVQGSMLQVPEGQALSLVGGDITVQAGTLGDGTIQAANLRAPGGQINLVSTASPVEVLAPSFQTSPNIDGASFNAMGTVTLKEGAMLDVSGQVDEFGSPIGNANSGTVFVRGGQLVLDASTILANTVGAVDGASSAVDIQVSQEIAMSNGAMMSVSTTGPGRAGDVEVKATNVSMDSGALIKTETSGDGNGGNITANVDTLSLTDATISSNSIGTDLDGDGIAEFGLLGPGGNVTVQGLQGAPATSVTLSNSLIFATTSVRGHGGDIHTTADSLTIENGSGIFTATLGGNGVGGDLVLNVGTLHLLDSQIVSATSNVGTDGVGGKVMVQGTQGAESAADNVELFGGQIASVTEGSGDSGGISIRATSLDLDEFSNIISSTGVGTGLGGDIVVSVQKASLSGQATITSSSSGAGAGGSVTVQGLDGVKTKAASLTLEDPGSSIISTAFGTGQLGDIEVHAETVSLKSEASILAGTQLSSSKTPGNVIIDADLVDISGRSRIASQVFTADAGQVIIKAGQLLTLNNGTIETSTSGVGQGGDVVLNVGSVSLANGATINSSSLSVDPGAGDAGNITIQSGSTVLLNDSSITTEADQASGGQIVITAPEMVRLINSEVSTSVADGTGGGGNITIDPQFVILQNSQMIAQAFAGSGGAINVTAGVFLADPNSVVDASSQQGPQGTVNIQSPVQNLGEELTPLSQQFSSAAAMLAQRCAARVADGMFSTFVVAGREGLPAEPGGFLASPSLTAELLGSNLSGRYPHVPIAAVTGSFPEYDARPIQLWEFVSACR